MARRKPKWWEQEPAPPPDPVPPPPPPPASTPLGVLRDRPPDLWSPITIKVTQTASTRVLTSLDPLKDYILELPDYPLKGSGLRNRGDSTPLVVRGCRRVVCKNGGELYVPQQDIPRWGLTGRQQIPDTQLSDDNLTGIAMRRLATFIDVREKIYLEGILGHGPDFSEGFQFTSPTADHVVQNVRMEGMHARDQQAFTDNHPDHFDLYGGVKSIRVDRFTGETDYQFIKLAGTSAPVGSANLRRVNIRAVPPTLGAYYTWESAGAGVHSIKYPHHFEDVWFEPRAGRALKQTVYHPDLVVSRSDELGEYLESAGSPLWTGRIRRGPPPGGDMVPAGSVGVSYVSPGYAT